MDEILEFRCTDCPRVDRVSRANIMRISGHMSRRAEIGTATSLNWHEAPSHVDYTAELTEEQIEALLDAAMVTIGRWHSGPLRGLEADDE